ncbi:MAG: hypothetical protein SGILL_005792 [Bacillariaceae sp.]
MPKKKTNYESKGFVRRIGTMFSSRGAADESSLGPIANDISESKWRPRKKKFERLDGDSDDDDLDSHTDDHYKNWTIKAAYSTESDAGEYKREILYERKRATLKHHIKSDKNRKRDLSSFSIKPPSKDTVAIRQNEIGTGSAKKKKTKTTKQHPTPEKISSYKERNSFEASFDSFAFQQTQGSVTSSYHDDESVSRHTTSSKNSFPTVGSDPTDFFSKEMKLTSNNLAKMAAISVSTKESLDGGSQRRYPSRGKFYQFTIDEDRESTVVESNIGMPLGFGVEEDTPKSYSDDEEDESMNDDDSGYTGGASQKTKIQERRVVQQKPFFFGSEHERTAPSEDFLASSGADQEQSEEFDAFFPDDAQATDAFNDDPFLEPPQASVPRPPRQASTHSLSYSPSPVNRKKFLQYSNSSGRLSRDERLPLSPLGNVKPRATQNGGGARFLLPPKPQANSGTKKPDPEWNGFRKLQEQGTNKPDPVAEFDAFGLSASRQQPKKREPSFQELSPEFSEEGSTKENPVNPRAQWSKQDSMMAFSSDSEDEGDDVDSFNSADLLEHAKGPHGAGIQNFSSGCSVASFGSKRIEVDGNKSVASQGKAMKPLGLPSNAIMASMLFRTHYNIDQQDVEKKIKAKEAENSKNKKSRQGDIPDSVSADCDYMTNVSSFSEETTLLQEAWRKPSRDLLDYFSKARSMPGDTRERLERQRSKAKAALFEA